MKFTNIEWTNLSSNPLRYRDARTGKVVWGCVKHSSGCANCYAEAQAERFHLGGPFTRATMAHLTPFLDEAELRHVLTAKVVSGRKVSGSKCFVGDMTDVFGDWVPDALLDRLFATLALRPDVTFQVLTKRADRLAAYWADEDTPVRIALAAAEIDGGCFHDARRALFDLSHSDEGKIDGYAIELPLPNVWLGVSVENQAAADERIPHLLRTPAAVRFLSCEPLLGPVSLDISRWGKCYHGGYAGRDHEADHRECECHLDWVIVGGESGGGARPMALHWARSLVEQCRAASVACFVKQLGSAAERYTQESWTDCDDQSHTVGTMIRLALKDKKGGDINEFPADLRIREFPGA